MKLLLLLETVDKLRAQLASAEDRLKDKVNFLQMHCDDLEHWVERHS